jgi:hypothetical protein
VALLRGAISAKAGRMTDAHRLSVAPMMDWIHYRCKSMA